MRVVSMLKHSLVILLIAIFISAPVMAIDARQRTSTTILPTTSHAATLYTITLVQPGDHVYVPGEDIRVNIFTTGAGGGLENDIGANSILISQGNTPNISLGHVPPPGLYFTRYRIGAETFINGFLVLPVTGGFSVEMVAEPACTATVTSAQTAPLKKFFTNLTAARMQAAASAVAPQWFAVNGQNFVVLLAKGIVLAYSGIGFIAIIAEKGIARDILALAVDFVGSVLTRAAEDMSSAAVLTQAERDLVKLVLSGLNNVIQTILAEGVFQRIVTLGQAANEVTLGGDADSQVLAKIVGDTVKKFEVLIRLQHP
jgi:hypothetical protein